MSFADIIAPFALCALAGLLLTSVELVRSFGKWIGRYWLNPYVLRLIALNVLAAGAVYAFLRYVLGVQNGLWLAIVTGLTFPSILRGRFTLYRPLDKAHDAPGADDFSLTLDAWYRDLQQHCYDEVNSLIAGERSQTLRRLRLTLKEKGMIEALADHIASEPLSQRRAEHTAELNRIKALSTDDERARLLAAFMMEIMNEQRIRQLLRGRT